MINDWIAAKGLQWVRGGRKSFQKKRGCLMTLTYNQKIMDEIRGEHKKWQKKLDELFRAAPERLERFSTVSDKESKNLYTPEDVAVEYFQKALGFPGEYPYTRGIQPSMYRGRLWTMRMF